MPFCDRTHREIGFQADEKETLICSSDKSDFPSEPYPKSNES
jgi:CDGSH-type Zn-finger protein